MTSLRDRLKLYAQGRNPYPEFLPLAQSDTATTVRDVTAFMEEHATCSHLANDASSVLTQLIAAPASFGQPEAITAIMLKKGLSAADFFARAGATEADVWVMPALDPRAQTQRSSVLLLSEFIRAQLGHTNEPYDFPAQGIFERASAKLGAAFDRAAIKQVVVATQNALVDLVDARRHSGSLTEAADILALLHGEEGIDSTFWTEKLADVRMSQIYSSTRGDVTRYKPVFRDPA